MLHERFVSAESASAVCADNVVQPPSHLVVGEEYEVKCGRRTHKGLLVVTGKFDAEIYMLFQLFSAPR